MHHSICCLGLILLEFQSSRAFVPFYERVRSRSAQRSDANVRYTTGEPQSGQPSRRQKKNKYTKFSKTDSIQKDPMELMIEESEKKLRALEVEMNQNKFPKAHVELSEKIAKPVSLEFPDNKLIDPNDPSSFGYTEVAVIMGAHGAKGQVKVKSTTDFPTERLCTPGIRHLRPLQKRAPRRIALVEGKPTKGDEFILTLGGVNTRDEAKRLDGGTLYIREEEKRSVLANINKDDNNTVHTSTEKEFFVSDLVGMEVFLEQENGSESSESKTFVGTVGGIVLAEDTCSTPGLGHDMLELVLPRGKGGTPSIHDELVLVPFVPQIVPRVEMEERAIYIAPPDGLLDLTYVREEKARIKGFLPSSDD